MKVILLKDVPKVGNRGDVKDFNSGYAQNALIARGLAEVATPKALTELNARKAKILKQKEKEDQAFFDIINQINNKSITLHEKANEKGHLFFAVPKKDLKQAIFNLTGLTIEEENIIIQTPIKELGLHEVKIKRGERQGICKIIIEKK